MTKLYHVGIKRDGHWVGDPDLIETDNIGEVVEYAYDFYGDKTLMVGASIVIERIG